jgi:hypothetical protein
MTILPLAERIEQEFANWQFPTAPAGLYEPVRYTIGLGGKRMRPLLALSRRKRRASTHSFSSAHVPICSGVVAAAAAARAGAAAAPTPPSRRTERPELRSSAEAEVR